MKELLKKEITRALCRDDFACNVMDHGNVFEVRVDGSTYVGSRFYRDTRTGEQIDTGLTMRKFADRVASMIGIDKTKASLSICEEIPG